MADPVVVPPIVSSTARRALAERDQRGGIEGMSRTAALVAFELAAAPVTTPDVVRTVADWHARHPDATDPDGRSTLLGGVYGGRAGRDWALNMQTVLAAASIVEEQSAKARAGVIAAGIAVVAADTGRVLLLQRAFDPTGEDEHGGKFEFPGGKLDEGEGAYEAAQREFAEEARIPVPGRLAGEWKSPDGIYEGFVHVVDEEQHVALNVDHEDRYVPNPDDSDGDRIETLCWWSIDDADGNTVLRREVLEHTPWDLLRQPVAVAAALAHVAAISDPLPIVGRKNLGEVSGETSAGRHTSKQPSLATTSKRLAKIDDDLRRKLRAGAEVAMADGLRRAGVKVTQRAGKRSRAVQASVASCEGVYPLAVLAAAGITEQEALAHAFDSFSERADRWIADAHRRKLAILSADLDVDATRADKARRRWQLARDAAVAFLVGSLTRMAFRRLTGTHPFDTEGEDAGVDVLVPMGLVGDALAVADGKPYSGDALDGSAVVDKWGPGVTFEVIDDSGRRSGIIRDGGSGQLVERLVWRWNDSEVPFHPHVDLDGTEATAATVAQDWPKDPSVFPYNTTYWFPGDHAGCRCAWDSSFEAASPGEATSGEEAVAAALGLP